MLSEAELPPAVGLVLKLASESPEARGPAVRCVRARVRSAVPSATGGTLDAMRLAAMQHREVAAAVLADIDSDAESSATNPPDSAVRFHDLQGSNRHLTQTSTVVAFSLSSDTARVCNDAELPQSPKTAGIACTNEAQICRHIPPIYRMHLVHTAEAPIDKDPHDRSIRLLPPYEC